ncbi:MAG: glycosyltransferase family 4 protein [Patescibacteria group bacterium]
MKILQINKFLYPKGGAETYLFNLSQLLEQNGYQVLYFSQKNPQNIKSAQADYFLSDLNLGKFSFSSFWRLGRIFWSFSASRQIKKLIRTERPDLIHLHNIYHQISPSILPAIKSFGLPIVMTVHDFKLVRPDYTLRADGRQLCHKNSRLVSWLLSWEFYFHHLLKIYERNIDLFIVPSEFVKKQLLKSGFKSQKILIIPHFLDRTATVTSSTVAEKYILSFGRLDESKGLSDLIKAYALSNLRDVKLKIAGAGPEQKNLEKLIDSLNLSSSVELLGHKNREELFRLVSQCLFTVFPSRVHETFGLGILESFKNHKPVIASRAGAFPELVKDGHNGLLFEVGDINQLRDKITELATDAKKLRELANHSDWDLDQYQPDRHYQKINALYRQLTGK